MIDADQLKSPSSPLATAASHSKPYITWPASSVNQSVPILHTIFPHLNYLHPGPDVPVFDISDYYNTTSPQNMLVNTLPFGAAIANTFSTPTHNVTQNNTVPDHLVVVQTHHGFTTVGANVEQAIYRAVYTLWNAQVQAAELGLYHDAGLDQRSVFGAGGGGDELALTEREASDCAALDTTLYDKEWAVWARQVEVDPRYQNDLGTAEVEEL